jgi:hypothetical protein
MRTTISIVILQLTAMVGLAAVAVAQSEETPTPPTPVLEQYDVVKQAIDAKVDSDAKQEVEAAQRGNAISLLYKRLEDAYSAIKKIESEIEKIDVSHIEALKAAANASPLVRAMPKSPQEPPDTSIPSPPAAPTIPNIPAPAKAEVDGSESFETVAGDISSAVEVGKYIESMPIPVLNGSTPEWVKNGLVLGEDLSFAISSTYMTDLEQCRDDLKSRMMSEVREYLDKNVLQIAQAYSLPELTQEYVEKYWVKKGQVFENIQDRPAGTFHQLWIGLHISSEQLSKIREWEKQTVREQRTKRVGIFGGVGVCAITLLSGAVGLLARREKAKLKG